MLPKKLMILSCSNFILFYSQAAEIISVSGNIENLPCSESSESVIRKARNEALNNLSNNTHYHQINSWEENDWYLNADGKYVSKNSSFCVSHGAFASATFVEKDKMHEEWFMTFESFISCAPEKDYATEAGWARTVNLAGKRAEKFCAHQTEPVLLERLSVGRDYILQETCYEIKAQFKCIK